MRRKVVFFLRHGQATHNVRAEAMRADGCSYEAFIAQMAADDEFDAALTAHGVAQAREVGATAAAGRAAACVDLVIASPLSRAIDTADLVLPAEAAPGARRVLREEWREISGLLLNAKRLPTSELAAKYAGGWDAAKLPTEHDALWAPEELEATEACAERGYQGLRWLWQAAEGRVAVAAHGGMFSFLMNHPRIQACEKLKARFHNCELRGCAMTAVEQEGGGGGGSGGGAEEPVFRLEWLDLEDPATFAPLANDVVA